MRAFILLLALLGCGPEDEMSAGTPRPVGPPGAVMSKNAQQRLAALNQQSYAPVATLFQPLLWTVDPASVQASTVTLSANTWYFNKIKNLSVDFTVNRIAVVIPAPGANVYGAAIYRSEISLGTGLAKMTMVPGTYSTRTGSGTFTLSAPVGLSHQNIYFIGFCSNAGIAVSGVTLPFIATVAQTGSTPLSPPQTFRYGFNDIETSTYDETDMVFFGWATTSANPSATGLY